MIPVTTDEPVRILIVDDEPSLRESLADFFRDRKYPVATAEHGKAALELLERTPRDLVITDIWMPHLDGVELLKAVKEKHPDTEVIMVTGHQNVDSAIAATRHGARDYITKPYDLHEMLHLVRNFERERALTRELELKRRQLERAQRLASLGVLAAGIMHEINNPNTYIQGNAEFLSERLIPVFERPEFKSTIERELKLPVSDLVKVVKGISAGSERITNIIRRATRFHAVATKEARPIAVAASLRQVLASLEPERAGCVTVRLPETPVAVMAGEEELHQVALELVANALEAIHGQPEGRVEIKVTTRDRQALIEVADNGPGLPPDRVSHLFEPFSTTKLDRPGHGFGLFIIHQIVENLRGTVQHQPRPGGGACFTVALPVAEDKK